MNESSFEFECSFPRVLVAREMNQELQHMEGKGKSGKRDCDGRRTKENQNEITVVSKDNDKRTNLNIL